MNRTWIAALVGLLLASEANAEPTTRCLLVRKPTREQTAESAADVQHLVDEYEQAAQGKANWQAALMRIFERFPAPVINVTLAENHSAWKSPERQLLAYVEATRQDPEDYEESAAVAKVVHDVQRELLPAVKRSPLLVIEARGVVRRRELDKMAPRVNGRACFGNLMRQAEIYEVSWLHQGRPIKKSVTPSTLDGGEDQCITIDGEAIGPCTNKPESVPPPSPAPPMAPSPVRAPSPPEPLPLAPDPPPIDYTLALTGLGVATVGFGVAVWANWESSAHLSRGDRNCPNHLCTPEGAEEVRTAGRWRTACISSGIVGLAGAVMLLASPYPYYRTWFSHRVERKAAPAAASAVQVVPALRPEWAALFVAGEF